MFENKTPPPFNIFGERRYGGVHEKILQNEVGRPFVVERTTKNSLGKPDTQILSYKNGEVTVSREGFGGIFFPDLCASMVETERLKGRR